MRLYEKHRPQTLDQVLGQPAIVTALKTFVLEPYPNILILEGESGTGKTAAAMILAQQLSDQGWFGQSVHRLSGADLSVDKAREYFDRDSDTPFRYKVANGKFHVLLIEELEWVSPQCQRYLKDALEEAQRNWRVVIVATSNNAAKLERALRHRFKPYCFASGPEFATAINDWLPSVWATEGGDVDQMPFGWESFGWDGEHFSARLALDRLEHYLQAVRAAGKAVVA